MAKATTESIAKRAMRDICAEAIPLYMRRKGATDIDMECLARIVRDAAQEGKRMGEKIGFDKGQEVGFDRGKAIGYTEGQRRGYNEGMRSARAMMRDERKAARQKTEFAADASGVPGKSASVVAERAAKAVKKTRRVMAARAPAVTVPAPTHDPLKTAKKAIKKGYAE